MGKLYIVSTPIGNLQDITIRAIKTLFSVDIIACEDTRKTGLLLQKLISVATLLLNSNKVKEKRKRSQLISYHDHNEQQKTPEIVQLIKSGKNVALVSDSGTPTISDPGFRLVQTCISKNIAVVSIPGPSAAIAALSISGLPTNNFLFLGYLPKKQGKRTKVLERLNESLNTLEQTPTVILYEAPHRLHKALQNLLEVFGDIEIVIARELTKIHEEIWRGTISKSLIHFPIPKGEYVILFKDGP